MNNYTREQLLVLAKLTAEDLEEIEQRRRDHNRLGFAYQLAFMRVYNRFPIQRPSFEIDHELLTFVGVQLDISVDEIEHYHTRQPTLSRHQEQIRAYLGLRRFDEKAQAELEEFLFEEACRLEQTSALLAIRDEIRAGNVYVKDSKRFGRFDDFFIADSQWESRQTAFFQRAGLLAKADEVPAYLAQRLDDAYGAFLEGLPENT